MRHDTALQQLLAVGTGDEPLLLVLDEQASALPPPRQPASRVLTNRCDVATTAGRAGWTAVFDDFVFGAALGPPCADVRYRISKEKRVVEQVLQAAWQWLPVGGVLWVAGYKEEGIKTFAARLAAAWQVVPELQRGERHLHLYRVRKWQSPPQALQAADYHRLQVIADWQGEPLYSKPGVFGWDRLDEGSTLLLQALEGWLAERPATGLRAVDLGCGFGLLALALCQAGCAEVVATDNNAAAITASLATLQQRVAAGQARVVAADCGGSLSGDFDLLLCNPPFHQGFAVEHELTEHFLRAARRLLRPGGRALFVVNRFVPLERKATALFREVRRLGGNDRFQVLALA